MRANIGSGLGARLWSQAAWGLIPVLPCANCVTLSKYLNLSVHQSFRGAVLVTVCLTGTHEQCVAGQCMAVPAASQDLVWKMRIMFVRIK